jgi:hypothetical protein
MELVLIVPDMSKKVDIRKIKREIISYVGTRLIDDSCSERVPGVLLKETIGNDDKERLSKLMSEDDLGVLIFIEVEDGEDYPEYYISAKAYKEEEIII